MKRFLIKTAIFSAIILCLLGLGELAVRNMPSSYSYKHAYMEGHARDISTLILGSSHTYYGVRSDLLGDSVFNLANVSQDPDIDLVLLRTYMDSMPGLRLVVLPVSYFTFVDPAIEDGPDWFRAIAYKIHMKMPVHSDFSRYNFEISDFDGYRLKLKSLLTFSTEGINRCDSLGWGLGFGLSTRSSDWEDRGARRARSTTLPLGARAAEVEKSLGFIMELCSSRGVGCVLVTTPVWHTYSENLDEAQMSDMRERVVSLCRRYGVRHIDMMCDTAFVSDDFHDVDHLSDIGAVRFTRMLADSLRSGAVME